MLGFRKISMRIRKEDTAGGERGEKGSYVPQDEAAVDPPDPVFHLLVLPSFIACFVSGSCLTRW